MAKKLVVIRGKDEDVDRVFPLPDAGSIIVGRSRETDTRLVDPKVSRQHCTVEVAAGRVLLQETAKSPGVDRVTLVNNEKVTQKQLTTGDVIRVGDTELRFDDDDPYEAATLGGDTLASLLKNGPGATGDILASQLVGSTVGRYKVETVVAQGHASVVFRATGADGQSVALKVLRPEFCPTEKDVQAFLQTMRLFIPLRQPNLLAVYDVDKHGFHCWAAMELVDGESLAARIARNGTATPCNWKDALRIGIQAARGLEALHKSGIVHRSITPRCILVGTDNQVKLGGLRLASRLAGTGPFPSRRPEDLLRELEYQPPERLRSEIKGDERSDIYSLGATLYALLAGRAPFDNTGSLPETLAQILQADPVRTREFETGLPASLQQALLKMIAKKPEQRFQSAAEVITELERQLEGPRDTAIKPRVLATDLIKKPEPLLSAARVPLPYEVLDEIGKGESATVFRGQDLALKRNVAIKELNEELRRDPQQAKMFFEEAQFLANLEHDHIVKVYGLDRERGWIIMELMRTSVARKLADGPLEPDLVRSVLKQSLDGLTFLHAQNKLHGGVKPTNLLVNAQGRVKLSDTTGLSLEGELQKPRGNMKYVAPEMLSAEFGRVGVGVDLYCLGFTALEMLVGPDFDTLFKGVGEGAIDPELGWLRLHGSRSEQIPKTLEVLPNAPPDLAQVIDRLLQRDVSQRYASAEEALNDLRQGPLKLFEEPKPSPASSPGTGNALPDNGQTGARRPTVWQHLSNPWIGVPVLGVLSFLFFVIMMYDPYGHSGPKGTPPPGQRTPRFALLVGVDTYGKDLAHFRHAEADMQDLSRVLTACEYKPANVVVLTQKMGETDPAKYMPTSVNIRQELRNLTEKRKPHDGLLLALAGQMVQFRGEEECWFCPADARLDDRNTLIPLSEIYKTLEKWDTDSNLVLLDVSREPLSGDDAPPLPVQLVPPRPQAIPAPKGVPVLFSCGPGKKGYVHLEARNGAFYYYVIRALQGFGDYDMTKRVTLEKLVRYATAEVQTYVSRAYGENQRPELTGPVNRMLTVTDFAESLPLFYEARGRHARRNYDQAIYYCNTTIGKTEYVEAYVIRADCKLQLGRPTEALADLKQALQLAPTDADAHAKMAQVDLALGQRADAAKKADEAVRLDPYYGPFYAVRGAVKVAAMESDSAFADFDKALKLNPRQPQLYNARGMAYLKLDDFDKAYGDFTEAIKLGPEDPTGFCNRGRVQEARKQPRKAIDEYTRALAVDGEYGPAYYRRALLYDQLAKNESDAEARKKLNEKAAADHEKVRLLGYQPPEGEK